MPSDTALAAEIGGKLALFGGALIEVKHAGMFRYGENWRQNIQEYLSEADWLVYLFTDQDEDWGFCLFECGFFRGKMEENDERRLITLTRRPDQINDALKEFNAVCMTEDGIYKLLTEIYREDPWKISPQLKDDILRDTATSIVKVFTGSERVEANFDVAPSVVVEFSNIDVCKSDLRSGRMPIDAIISGIKDWQKLFGRQIDTGSWLWSDLVNDWEYKDVYEFLIARMMSNALQNRVPKGMMIRVGDSNEVYRLTLRRYERLASSRYRFHFTASLLDLPFSLDVQKTGDKQTVLYHLVVLSWYFRRRVVEELYSKILESIISLRQKKKTNVLPLFEELTSELIDIDAQSIIRGVDRQLIVQEALGNDPETVTLLRKLDDWYSTRSNMIQAMERGQSALDEVAKFLCQMAMINFDFYQAAARAYARGSKDLERPHELGISRDGGDEAAAANAGDHSQD